MKIAIDVMGGDFAPECNIDGVLSALSEDNELSIIAVGDKEKMGKLITINQKSPERLEIVHTTSIVAMDESPSRSLREKPDSSISICANLVRDGKSDAMVTAGNTGATVAYALMRIGRLEGVNRPALATVFPTQGEPSVVIDVGANARVKPINLLEFAIMGQVYAEEILGIENPNVGLLSVGEEEAKGYEVIKEANHLLKEARINFYGNIEGGDILKGTTNVIVCDGFVGNVVLKFAESISGVVFSTLKMTVAKNIKRKMGAWLMKPAFRDFKRIWDPSEYGGAPLIGLNGVCIICHGSSSPKAIKNGIFLAKKCVKKRINEKITEKTKVLVKVNNT
ncbi:MAG: phosphate acyltransferase PlsX [bacterium]